VRAGGSQRVREIQSRLNRLGFHAGEVDGLFGPITEFAVVAYQADKSLPVDGIVGPQTELALTGFAQRAPGSDGTRQAKGEQPSGRTRQNAGADRPRPRTWEASGDGNSWTPVLWVAAVLLALAASAAVLLRALAPRLTRIRSARRAARTQRKVSAPGAAGLQTTRAGGPVTATAIEKEETDAAEAAPPPTLEWLVARIRLVEGPEEEAQLIHIGPELIAEGDKRSWKTGLLDDQGIPFAIASEVDFESCLRDVIVSEGLPRLVEILRKDGLDLSKDDLESMPLVVELSADLRERLALGQPMRPSEEVPG
jgi:peptidoglycan hydrolase-like protein with peptidoglycan-binding domain